MASKNLQGAAFALASMAVYATHDVIVKFLGGTFSAAQILFFSALLSFPLITVFLLQDRSGGTLLPRNPGWVAARTATSILATVGAFYAFAHLPLAQVYAILFSTPLLITVLAIPILGERVEFRRWLAVIVGLIGVLIVVQPGTSALAGGHLAALVAAAAGAFSSVSVRRIGNQERAIVLLIYPAIANILVMGITLPFIYLPVGKGEFGLMAVIAALGLLGALLTILAYRRAEAMIAAPMQYSQMLWAIFYGALFFNEVPDLHTLAGAAIIIASGAYILLRESRPGNSANRPVLATRSRGDEVTKPRPSLLGRILAPPRGASGDDDG